MKKVFKQIFFGACLYVQDHLIPLPLLAQLEMYCYTNKIEIPNFLAA
jgi:hypothetical protein